MSEIKKLRRNNLAKWNSERNFYSINSLKSKKGVDIKQK